jgi:pimeloyl-ACP methyl ester carboxylesterase
VVNSGIDDVGFVAALIDAIGARVSIDRKQVFATGISNGGMMVYRLACEIPDKVAAVAPVAPPAIPQNCSPSQPVSIMHIHGTADRADMHGRMEISTCLLSELARCRTTFRSRGSGDSSPDTNFLEWDSPGRSACLRQHGHNEPRKGETGIGLSGHAGDYHFSSPMAVGHIVLPRQGALAP